MTREDVWGLVLTVGTLLAMVTGATVLLVAELSAP